MNEILGYPKLTGWPLKLAAETVGVCLAFVGIFVAIAFVYNIAVTMFRSHGMKPFDFSKLARVAVLAFTLGVYIPLALGVGSLMEIMFIMTKPKSSKVDIAAAYVSDTWDEKKAELSADGDLSVVDYGEMVTSSAGATVKTLGVGIFGGEIFGEGGKLILRMGIGKLNSILMQIFFCLGPFAILFSILPGFEQKFFSWFSIMITFMFVPVVFNIIDAASGYDFAEVLKEDGITNSANVYIRTSDNLVFLIIYLLPYWIAGIVVGNANAGRALSQTGQLATMTMGRAASVMSNVASTKYGGGASKSGGKNPGGVDNVAGTGRDGMDVQN